ncbi:MAG: hypothetical protein GXO11_06840 [Epsilonproteobacteria bacterium]|nr:hypothetical protein [Campylobacterota bacterium]
MTHKFLMKFLIFVAIITIDLLAQPSISEAKAALKANPALLDSPQAKALMEQKGLTKQQVEAELKKTTTATQEVSQTQEEINNDVEVTTDIKPSIRIDKKLTRKINPFALKSTADIDKQLSKKQQFLVKKKLKRYSSRFFVNKNVLSSSSLPTPDSYIISNGDALVVYIYGDRDETYTPTVKNDGTIELPYVGPITIGGMRFIDAKKHLIAKLKKHYKLSEFYINMQKYSTIQVTLIGDVKAPGLYNLASFSTIKDLLLASKGLNPTASVRNIKIKRDGKIIKNVDFYDLLFHANQVSTTILKQGDIVIVSEAKKLVSIDGYVNQAAIFELKEKESLATLIEYAGGMKPNASKRNIVIKRYDQNNKIVTLTVEYAQAGNFLMNNGDQVYIYPLDFSMVASINIYGNVIRPGSYHLPKDATLNSLLKAQLRYGKNHFFLPQTYFDYAVIKRYDKKLLEYKTFSFNLRDVIDGKQTVLLQPQDQLYIFAQNDIFSNAYVTTIGSVLQKPGKLQYFDGMTILDAINASGIAGALDDMICVTTFNTPTNMPKMHIYSLAKDAKYIQLHPYDEVEVYNYYDTHSLKPVSISGEVLHPIKVYYEKGLTLDKLIKKAGGFTPRAYKKKISIVRYYINEAEEREQKILEYNLDETPLSQIILEPYDEVKVYKIPNWNEKQVVEIKGEVKFPGSYVILPGEKIADLIKRAGGFTENAFIEGAVFTRESIRKKQLQQYQKALARIKRKLAIFNAMPANAKVSMAGSNATSLLTDIIQESKKYQPIGRVGIVLDEDLETFEESSYNITLQDKDQLIIPSKVETVTVFGEVMNPTSFIYDQKFSGEDYIKLASGVTQSADEERIYVIHPNGNSEPLCSSTLWIFNSCVDIQKGDTIVVPLYIKEYNGLDLWESVSKIMASFAVTAATLTTLGVF